MKNKIIPVIAGLIFFISLYVIFYKIIPAYKQFTSTKKILSGEAMSAKNKEYLLKAINETRVKRVKAGNHRLSTYLFTFLTFVDYLNQNGFKAQLSLKKSVAAVQVSFAVPHVPVTPVPKPETVPLKSAAKPEAGGLYFSAYRNMPGIKKVGVTLKISEIPNLEDYIFIFRVLQTLPVIVKSIVIKNSNNFYSKISLVIIGRQ